MASPRSIEIKVGLLILAALGLLAGFVVVMGGISFQPKYEMFVGFDNPGGLKAGAPVKIAGVTVGKVKAMEFLGGTVQPTTEKPMPLVRARVSVEKRYQNNIRDNAVFYITVEGILGEAFLAIDPGSSDRPVLADGAEVRGLDPPRIDRVVAEAYDLLTTVLDALREHRPALRDAISGFAKTFKGAGMFMENNMDRLDRIAVNVEQMSLDGTEAVRAARRQYVDNPQIERMINNADRLVTVAARDVPVVLADGRDAIKGAKKVVQVISNDAQLAKIKGTLDDVSTIATQAKATIADARAIAAHVRSGRGSAGALLMDEQLYDDLQEMARDLKHNPWKFFWKE